MCHISRKVRSMKGEGILSDLKVTGEGVSYPSAVLSDAFRRTAVQKEGVFGLIGWLADRQRRFASLSCRNALMYYY
jgi:hypothetical protein